MRSLLIVLAALLPVRAEQRAPETMRFTQPAYWLKPYSTSFIKEHWTLTLVVKDFDKAFPKALAAFTEAGAVSMEPLTNLAGSKTEKSQQLRYRLTLQSGGAVVKKLRKLGVLDGPRVLSEPDRPDLSELKTKVDKLISAKKDHAPELGRMPDVSALVDETLEHLLLVESVSQQTGGELLLNMTLRQATASVTPAPLAK